MSDGYRSQINDTDLEVALDDYPDWFKDEIKALDYIELFKLLETVAEYSDGSRGSSFRTMVECLGYKVSYDHIKYKYVYEKQGKIY